MGGFGGRLGGCFGGWLGGGFGGDLGGCLGGWLCGRVWWMFR